MKRTWKTLLSAILMLVMIFQIAGAGTLNALADEDKDPYADLNVSVRFGFVNDEEGSASWVGFDPDKYDEDEGVGSPSFSIGGVDSPSLKDFRDSGVYVTPPKGFQVVGFFFLPTGSGFSGANNLIGSGWAEANSASVSFSMPDVDESSPLDCDYTIYIALDRIPADDAVVTYRLSPSEASRSDINISEAVGDGHKVIGYADADLDSVFQAHGIDASVCNFVNWYLLYPNGTICTVDPGDTIRPFTSCTLYPHLNRSEDVHSFGEAVELKAPGCTEPGEAELTCTVCGHTLIQEILPLGHDWDEGEVIEIAEGDNKGVIRFHCTRCSETCEQAIVFHPAVPATCTSDGTVAYYELEDGTLFRDAQCKLLITSADIVVAGGHQWGDWVTTTAPTADTDGEATRECSVCHETETQPVPALGAPPAVLEGDGQTWQTGDTEGLTFRFDLDYALFDHQIMIDGVVYNEEATRGQSGRVFTSRPGSTIITIDPSFLGGYYSGSHTLVALYAGGAATEPATFTVTGAPLAPAGTPGTTTLSLGIDVAALTKVYDGVSFDLNGLNSSIALTGLPSGYKAYFLLSFDDASLTKFKNVGFAAATAYPLQVLDASDADVSALFSADPLHFTISITARPITVAAYATKTYDGTPLTVNASNAAVTAGSLVSGQTIGELTSSVTLTDAGFASAPIVSVKILEGSADVTSNYSITLDQANVSIEKMSITVTAATLAKVYDGVELEFKKEDITFAPALPSSFTFSVAVPSKFVDVAKKDVTLATLKILLGSVDVTANFNITIVPGSMEIVKRPITIETKSATKVYDGKPLTNKAVVTPVLYKLDGDQIQLKFTGSQTAIGQSDNTCTATIVNKATNKDVTANYDITYKFGKLTVTNSSGGYTPSTDPKMGDEANMTLWIVLLSVAVVTAAVVVVVYLRNRKNNGKAEDQV